MKWYNLALRKESREEQHENNKPDCCKEKQCFYQEGEKIPHGGGSFQNLCLDYSVNIIIGTSAGKKSLSLKEKLPFTDID